MKLNKEIQGLRAVAVLSVIFTHLQASWLPGGFVGVDVFFVISGYLITSMLVNEFHETGTIKFSNFYKRRVRRLFPALLATCFFTVLAGFLLLGDENFDFLIDSAFAAIFSVSNLYFWSQVGYFDAEALTKPLLHTWSLGVEEQFYLLWPLLILLVASAKSKILSLIFLAVIGIGSFILNWLFIDIGVGDELAVKADFLEGFLDGGSTAFYNMPFRIFEFSVGAFVYLSGLDRIRINRVVGDIVFIGLILGIGLLMTGITEESVFPYYNALYVSLVSAALIVVSSRCRLGTAILGNSLMTFIGGLSYSLYLVHWPLIVFYLGVYRELNIYSSVLLFALMFILAWLLNKFVENKFRYPPKVPQAKNISGFRIQPALPITSVVVVITIIFLGNVQGRVPESRATFTNKEWRDIRKDKYCTDSMAGFPVELFTCQKDRNSDHTVVVWGDSHGIHLVAGMAELYQHSNIAVAYTSGCISQSGFQGFTREFKSEKLTKECIDRNNNFLEWAKNYKGQVVIFISNAKRHKPEKIALINNMHINTLLGYGHDAFVLGDFIRPGVQLAQCYAVPDFILSDEVVANRCVTDTAQQKRELEYSKKLADNSINYIPVHESQCPNDVCRYFDDNGKVTYRDHHHLSVRGSIYELSKASELINKYYPR